MKNRITQYKISNLPFKEQLYSKGGGGGGGDDSFPRLNILASRQLLHMLFQCLSWQKTMLQKMQNAVFRSCRSKNIFMWRLYSVLTVPLQRGTSKLFTRRKVESGVHQWTHLIFQVTAHRNSEFRFLSDVIHSQL